MVDWKKIKKIDAHIHILPDEVAKLFDNEFAHATLEEYKILMDKYNIDKAIIMPFNDNKMLSLEKNTRKVHENLAMIKESLPGRLLAFADLDIDGGYTHLSSPYHLKEAIETYHLDGLKIHPTNNGIEADSLYLVPALRKASEYNLPVVIHSLPSRNGIFNTSSPSRIANLIEVFDDLTIITAHMGGYQWMDALSGCGYVDMSFILPELVELYGIEQTNRILRKFGAERLLFATDYPLVRDTNPEDIYEKYFSILNQMDFTEEEAEKIAYKNIQKIMKLKES